MVPEQFQEQFTKKVVEDPNKKTSFLKKAMSELQESKEDEIFNNKWIPIIRKLRESEGRVLRFSMGECLQIIKDSQEDKNQRQPQRSLNR